MMHYDVAYDSPEDIARHIKQLSQQLHAMGRVDLLHEAISAQILEDIRLETAKKKLRTLNITSDYRFILDGPEPIEIELQPVHKAVYLLFLAHPEGIEFKRLSDYRDELLEYYYRTARFMDKGKIRESVDHLTNPLDNAINEKCSRIKQAFLKVLDEYTASYYIISGHARCHVEGSPRTWYKRLKQISLPREYVVYL